MRSSRVSARVCLAAALSAGLLAPASARAQQVALDRFEPAPAGDRMFGVESPYALGSGVAHVALLFDYAHNPYTLKHGPGQSDVLPVVSDQMFLHLDASIAILDRVNLNFSVPAAVLLPSMLFTGKRGWKTAHVGLAVVFLALWAGTVVTGLFFLPHRLDAP